MRGIRGSRVGRAGWVGSLGEDSKGVIGVGGGRERGFGDMLLKGKLRHMKQDILRNIHSAISV